MKLTIERERLLRSLQHAQGVIERRTTIPILSNVLLKADGGTLALTATDMDIAIVERVECMVAQPGATTVPAQTLFDVVRKLPDGAELEIASGGEQNQLVVRCGRSRISLATLPSEDFPAMTEGELPHGFAMGAKALCEIIDRTRFAMSSEETRYYLNGIYIHPAREEDEPKLRIVATDGHRLARVELNLPDGADEMPGVIVPRKTVGEIRKLIDDAGEEEVAITLSDTKIRVEIATTVLTSKLIDGTFPDYDRVIPFANDKTLQVDPRNFAKAVDLVSTIATEKTRAIKLSLDDGSLVLSASSPDAGSAEEQLEVEYADGPLEIGFNSRYLLDIAQLIGDDGARFMLSDGTSPTLVRDNADPGALYVLMPMRV